MTPRRVSITVSAGVTRSPDEVFDFVSNYANDPGWRAGVTSMRHDPPGSVHVGMHTHEVMRFFGRTIEVEAAIIGLEPGRSVSFRSVAGPLQAEGIRRVEAKGSGAIVTYEAVADLTGLLALLAPVVVRSFRTRAESDLGRLKLLLEESPRGESP